MDFVPPLNTQRDRLFDANWLFHRGDAPGAEQPSFADADWRQLDLPHDWSVEDIPGDAKLPGTFSPVVGVWKHILGDNDDWAAVELDDSGWVPLTLPTVMPTMPPKSYAWFRRQVVFPAGITDEPFLLCLGRISDCDEVYLNGQLLGKTGVMPKNQPQGMCIAEPSKAREYWVNPSQVRPGNNLVAVCIYKEAGQGGIYADVIPAAPEVVGPFTSISPGGTASGYTIGGIGWYRKHFQTGAGDLNRHFEIVFGGAYMNSDVWLNGHHVGFHAYGYTSFCYDLTPYMNPPGCDNVIAMRLDSSGVTSRWYPGSGIYRHVWLGVTDPVHVRRWGVHIQTPVAKPEKGEVDVRVEVQGKVTNQTARIRLLDAAGSCVAQAAAAIHGNAVAARLTILQPALWSTLNPSLYKAEVTLLDGARELDQVVESFGIREIKFSVENGFQLNGQTVKMLGGCIHHDNGLLGAIALERAEIRKVQLLKANGYNALRCSHNTMSDALFNACDRLGILVMDETFDQWYVHKTPQDYGGEVFEKWYAKDIELMLRCNRNHPSIVIWSLGNEIGKREGDEDMLVAALKKLKHEVHKWDTTRPVTGGNAQSAKFESFMEMFDLKGYNYREPEIASDHAKHPDWISVCAESRPENPLETWNFVHDRSWVVGSFVWAAQDYIGESWCGWVGVEGEDIGWPSFTAPCGAIDLCGFPKGQQLYRNVMAGLAEIEILVLEPLAEGQKYKSAGWSWPLEYPNWTWPGLDGKSFQVKVVSRCPEVRLLLNGRLIGQGATAKEKIDVVFEVPYEVGELRAEGWRDGQLVATRVLRSAGKAVALRLTADRAHLSTSRSDLAYVAVEVVDAQGAPVCVPEVTVRYRVSGAGVLEAAGNGNHRDMRSFRQPEGKTWRGRSLAILRPTGQVGRMTLTVEADGLAGAELDVMVED